MLDVLQLEKYTNKKLEFNNELELSLINNKENFDKIIESILKNAIDYGMKSLEINKDFNGVFKSVKDIEKSKELKDIVKSSVNISLSQALENQKGNINILKNLNNFKEMTLKGGLRFLLTAGVEILFSKVSKLNLFRPIVEKLTQNIKNFIMSNSFIQKLNSGINKILNKTNEYKKMCENWYKAYDEFNIDLINDIAKN